MVSVYEISAMLRQVALSSIPLDEFDEWLTEASWNMHKDSDPAAVEMVGKIERVLAEYEGGHISEAELLQNFEHMSGLYRICIACDSRVIATASVSTYRAPIAQFERSVAADRRFSLEFSYTPALQA